MRVQILHAFSTEMCQSTASVTNVSTHNALYNMHVYLNSSYLYTLLYSIFVIRNIYSSIVSTQDTFSCRKSCDYPDILVEILLRTRKPQPPRSLSKEEFISLKAIVHNSHLYSLKITTGNAQHLF